jgi:hypothetical protein
MMQVAQGESVRVRIEHDDEKGVYIWCHENVGKRFDTWDRDWVLVGAWDYAFSREQDATAFLLRWS